MFASKDDVLNKSTKEMATHADLVCVEHCNDDWLKDQIRHYIPISHDSYHQMNGISFGNLAYMSLYCNDAEIRKISTDTLNQWRKYNRKWRNVKKCMSLFLVLYVIAGIIYVYNKI